MTIERSLEQIATLISDCWDLRHNPKELDYCRSQIQKSVEELIEDARSNRGVLPLSEEKVREISNLVTQFNELECILEKHKSAIDTVISGAVISVSK